MITPRSRVARRLRAEREHRDHGASATERSADRTQAGILAQLLRIHGVSMPRTVRRVPLQSGPAPGPGKNFSGGGGNLKKSKSIKAVARPSGRDNYESTL